MKPLLIALMVCLAVPAQAQQAALPDLSGNGAYSHVQIAGFALPIADVTLLYQKGLLRYNPQSERFSFGPAVTSERGLKRATAEVPLQSPDSLHQMYRMAKVPFPRGAGHTLTIPSGFGPMRFSDQEPTRALSLSMGGVSRVPYTDDADGGLSLALSFGDGFRGLGASISLSMNDISNLTDTDRMSFGFKLNRYLTDGLSLSVGGENLFVGKTDGVASYFAVLSRGFDKGALPYSGAWTLGAGSGRFADNTPRDVVEGKSPHGTTLFGAVALDLTPRLSVIGEWNGRNLAAGLAYRFEKPALSVTLGVRDLTDASGDGARVTGSLGFTLVRF